MSSLSGQDCLRWRPATSGLKFKLTQVSLHVALCVYLCAGHAKAHCCVFQCPGPPQRINRRINTLVSVEDACFENGTVVQYVCSRGFQRFGDGYNATCNGASGKWEPNGECQIDLLSLLIAVLLMLIVLLVFALFICQICERRKHKILRLHLRRAHQRAQPDLAIVNNLVENYRPYDREGQDGNRRVEPEAGLFICSTRV